MSKTSEQGMIAVGRALAEPVRRTDLIADSVIRDIVRDNRAPQVPAPASPPLPRSATPGWIEPRPLGPQPGAAIIDRMMDQQDALDRAELIRRLKGLANE